MAYETEWTPGLRNALLAPFDRVEFLPKGGKDGGKAQGMPYIDARDVMKRLDDAVGVGGWSFTYDVIPGPSMMVRGSLVVLGVLKCDAGEADKEGEPLKSAVSDALKRCAVHFGIGRYLYELEGPFWGKLNQWKKWEEPPRINAQVLTKALKAVGYTWNGELPEVRTVAAPSYEDEPQRTAPAPSNGSGQQRAPESRGDAAATRTSPASAEAFICVGEGCNATLLPAQKTMSEKKFGVPLCPKCQTKRQTAATR